MSHSFRPPFRTAVAFFLAVFLATTMSRAAFAADETIDLTLSSGIGWRHASGKPLDTAPDPLKKHTHNVVVIPENLDLLMKDVAPIKDAESVTIEWEAYLENGNTALILGTATPGANQGKGYCVQIDTGKTVSVGYRGGFVGPWEWMSNADVTRDLGWVKLKFVWSKDGALQLYVNGDLYVEKDDSRLPLVIDQIQIQTNGTGKKYFGDAKLTITR